MMHRSLETAPETRAGWNIATPRPMRDVPALGLGVIASVPVGRRLNRKLGKGPLTRILALGLLLVSVRTAPIAF